MCVCVLHEYQKFPVIVAERGEKNHVLHYPPEQILHAAMKMLMYCHPVVQSKVLLQINILFPSAGLCE